MFFSSEKQPEDKPCGLESKQTAGSKLIISQQNEKKANNNDPLMYCKFKVTRNRYYGSQRSEVKKADPCVSLMYSTGSSAGLGRPCPLGHRSLMDTSFTETLGVDDRERDVERERWKRGHLEKRKERRWELEKVKGILYSCSSLLGGAGIRDLPSGPEDRTVKSCAELKEEYKEEAMAEDVVTLFHLG